MIQRFLQHRLVISLGLICVVVVTPCLAKVKRRDTVIMKNGDRLTGEVKRLEEGSIRLSNNFHLNFSFWDNFDSQPPLSAKKNATGLSTDLGWTF
jgi:hypothetical protein